MRTDRTTHTTYTFALAADVTRFVWDNQDVLLEANAGGVTQTGSGAEGKGGEIGMVSPEFQRHGG